MWALLPFDPPIRNAPVPMRSWAQQSHLSETVHNPVIFADPEMKGRLSAGSVNYTEKPLQLFDVQFEITEDLAE